METEIECGAGRERKRKEKKDKVYVYENRLFTINEKALFEYIAWYTDLHKHHLYTRIYIRYTNNKNLKNNTANKPVWNVNSSYTYTKFKRNIREKKRCFYKQFAVFLLFFLCLVIRNNKQMYKTLQIWCNHMNCAIAIFFSVVFFLSARYWLTWTILLFIWFNLRWNTSLLHNNKKRPLINMFQTSFETIDLLSLCRCCFSFPNHFFF